MKTLLLLFGAGFLASLWNAITFRYQVDSQPASVPEGLLAAVLGPALIASACFFDIDRSPFWPVLLGVGGFSLILKAAARRMIARHEFFGTPRAHAAAALFFLAAGGLVFKLDATAWRGRHERAQRSRQVAEIIEKARTDWRPGPGVVEVKKGPLIAWLAAAPRVVVDWAYEQERGAAALRRIPISAAVLNDSFKDVPGTDAPWRLELRRAGSDASFKVWTGASEAFAPAQRRDLQMTWDGRDETGRLAPPGAYEASFTAFGMEARAPVLLEDGGPEVRVIQDPKTLLLQQQQRSDRYLQSLSEGIRQLNEFRRR